MNEQVREQIAAEMRTAQDAVCAIAPFTDRDPSFDLDAAYAVAERIHRARCAEGRRAVGRKIGFTNYEMWELYGVRAPIWAHVYDSTVELDAAADATCSLAPFVEPRIEPEIVFRFAGAPQAGISAAELLASIDGVALGFEVVQSHFPGWRFRAPDTVADGSLHARLFVGAFRPRAALGDDPARVLESFTLRLLCNGEVRAHGGGKDVLGSPLNAIVHLIDTLQQQGAPAIRAGEIVTTGTLAPAQPVTAGEVWDMDAGGLGLPPPRLRFAV